MGRKRLERLSHREAYYLSEEMIDVMVDRLWSLITSRMRGHIREAGMEILFCLATANLKVIRNRYTP